MNGFYSENLIIAKLEQKCDLKRDAVYDHQYKLDFIVDRFKNIDKLIHIGVQVTTNPNDPAKQREFVRERKKKTLVDRSLYVKVAPGVDIDHWGAELIYNAIVSFSFQEDLKQKYVLGVMINPDVTYEFFELEDADDPVAKEKNGFLHGTIAKYVKEKGFGFIEAEGGRWFFHINDVEDENLKDNFLPNAEVEPETKKVIRPIYVDFQDGGRTRPEAVANSAHNVRLSRKN